MLPDGKAFWLCSVYHLHITPVEDLLVTGYKGREVEYWNDGMKKYLHRFKRMTTLRQLKKRSQKYHYEFAHNTPLDYKHIERSQ